MTKEKKNSEITRKYGDPWIWGTYIALIIVSLIESYSASSQQVAVSGVIMPIVRHAVYLAIGATFMWGISRLKYNASLVLGVLVQGFALLTLLLLVLAMFVGENVNGAQRAVSLGIITVQPAEFAKFSIVTLLAWVLSRNQKVGDVKTVGIVEAALMVGLYCGLMLQSGLTNTLLLFGISVVMMICGGVKFKKLLWVLVAYVVIFGVFMAVKSSNDKKDDNLKRAEMVAEGQPVAAAEADTVKATSFLSFFSRFSTWQSRVKAWANRDSLVYKPINSDNQQEMFARMAQAHGGITGVGLGQSRECSRLPLAFSDYIYSIIIEEAGLVGGTLVMLLYLALLARAAMIMRRCQRTMPALLVMGMASMIALQAMFHMAINTGFFPVSGQPLPLISNGGTSILVISMAFGVMLSVSRTIAGEDYRKNVKSGKVATDAGDQPEPEVKPSYLNKPNEWK